MLFVLFFFFKKKGFNRSLPPLWYKTSGTDGSGLAKYLNLNEYSRQIKTRPRVPKDVLPAKQHGTVGGLQVPSPRVVHLIAQRRRGSKKTEEEQHKHGERIWENPI
jgi:hypothetical protein